MPRIVFPIKINNISPPIVYRGCSFCRTSVKKSGYKWYCGKRCTESRNVSNGNNDSNWYQWFWRLALKVGAKNGIQEGDSLVSIVVFEDLKEGKHLSDIFGCHANQIGEAIDEWPSFEAEFMGLMTRLLISSSWLLTLRLSEKSIPKKYRSELLNGGQSLRSQQKLELVCELKRKIKWRISKKELKDIPAAKLRASKADEAKLISNAIHTLLKKFKHKTPNKRRPKSPITTSTPSLWSPLELYSQESNWLGSFKKTPSKVEDLEPVIQYTDPELDRLFSQSSSISSSSGSSSSRKKKRRISSLSPKSPKSTTKKRKRVSQSSSQSSSKSFKLKTKPTKSNTVATPIAKVLGSTKKTLFCNKLNY